MRIALVCPYDWSRPGGVRGHVAELAERLAGAHEVRVFAPASEAVDEGVEVVGRPVGIRFNQSVAPVAPVPTAGVRVVRALRAFAPDIVHVHEPVAPAVALAASAAGPAPLVGTFHAWSESRRLYHMTAPVARRIVGRLGVRIAVSTAARDFAAGALGLPPQAFRVIPNGVDVERFAAAEPLAELVDPGRPLLAFVGRLERRKGLDVLVRAFIRLRASQPEVRLVVVGDGPDRQRCAELLPASVRPDVWFSGRVDEPTKARILASADVFVAPNTTGESFGIVLLEAMAAGLPVVASDIPGFRTVLGEGQHGRLVPPGDAAALAETLHLLVTSPPLRRAMGAAGRADVQRFAWQRIVDEVQAAYDEARLAADAVGG